MWNEDYKEMLLSLQSEGVDFILVGAYAMAAQGFPRATQDIDIWIIPSHGNAEKTMRALKKFGAPLHQVNTGDFETDDTIFQIGVAPRRIDLITGISGVTPDEAVSQAQDMTVGGVTLKILPIGLLIKNKIASGRPRDLADVEELKKLK